MAIAPPTAPAPVAGRTTRAAPTRLAPVVDRSAVAECDREDGHEALRRMTCSPMGRRTSGLG